MKKLIALILILSFSFANANRYVASPNQPQFPSGEASSPISDQGFYFWRQAPGCFAQSPDEVLQRQVDIEGTNINVFIKEVFPLTCASPPPPFYVNAAAINGLNAGTYNLNFYSIPFGGVFPPAVADYPNYFIESIQFAVVQGPPDQASPVLVNSTTNIGLILLSVLMLFTGLYFCKLRY